MMKSHKGHVRTYRLLQEDNFIKFEYVSFIFLDKEADKIILAQLVQLHKS